MSAIEGGVDGSSILEGVLDIAKVGTLDILTVGEVDTSVIEGKGDGLSVTGFNDGGEDGARVVGLEVVGVEEGN
jgi:hypothetical protein